MPTISFYKTPGGQVPYKRWISGLRDRQARAYIERRLLRLIGGNLGDCKYCRDGVWELRISYGPGYRVYYGTAGNQVIVLLVGGDKSSQNVDITQAVAYWKDWLWTKP